MALTSAIGGGELRGCIQDVLLGLVSSEGAGVF